MGHQISQAPATVVLCNRLNEKLCDIQDHIAGIAKVEPTTEALLTFSLVVGWCADARSLVMEIKSQL